MFSTGGPLSGRLYIIGTPIGNLGDLTLRARQAFEESQFVFCEDTRVSIKLLNHLGLKRKLISCHDYNEEKRLPLLEELVREGSAAALISDAGTPLVSDPGFQIVQRAIELGIAVIPIPGPSAFLMALVGSGLPCERFAFEGFLPQKSGDRKQRIERLRDEERTIIFYVPPHDQQGLLEELLAALGNRRACLARELTKVFEEFRRGHLQDLLEGLKENPVRGECVLVVEGAGSTPKTRADLETVQQELIDCLERGDRLKEAAAFIAGNTGWSKSEVYKLGLEWINRQDNN
jgi:16S rRNA (cytidine1402-2'-O)-methyltransferase